MKAYERLLNYVVVRTPSDENSETVPSSACQFDLARLLEAEMKDLGLTDVVLDDQCYLYGKLPATAGLEDKPAIGFIAHMDTVSDTVTMISNQSLLKIMTVASLSLEQVILY